VTLAEADWAGALEVVCSGSPVVLMCHVSPDGDALGSTLAVGLALRARGVDVVASYDEEPMVVPKRLRFLPGQELLVPPSAVPERPGVVVTFDTGSIDRLGRLAGPAKAAGALVVVDHHMSNTMFGTHHLLDVEAAATAVVALDFVDRLHVPLSADIATAIYTGLTTDTGSFRFAATTAEVHEIAARLLRAGAPHDQIGRDVFDTFSFGYLQLLAGALEHAAVEPEALAGRGLVWTVVTAAQRAACEVAYDEVEAVIGTLRVTEEAEVAVVCKETDEGAYAVSTRSKGAVDVARACVALGGGGHTFAAGFTSNADIPTTMARLRAELELAICE
jgi:phosphoesterase RecJ-like protein